VHYICVEEVGGETHSGISPKNLAAFTSKQLATASAPAHLVHGEAIALHKSSFERFFFGDACRTDELHAVVPRAQDQVRPELSAYRAMTPILVARSAQVDVYWLIHDSPQQL
jgi:hypothetical protein